MRFNLSFFPFMEHAFDMSEFFVQSQFPKFIYFLPEDIQLLQQHLLKRLPTPPLLNCFCTIVKNQLGICVSLFLAQYYSSLVSFKNYHLIHFLSLSLWKISHIYKSREHYNQPSILVQLRQLSPLPFYLFEESSAVFLYNIPYSGFVSHSVIYFFLLFPGPRRLINSGYTFGSLHHMRRHMRVISVLAMVLFS